AGKTARPKTAYVDSAAAGGAKLIYRHVVDSATIVGSLMPVEIMLVLPTGIEQVIAAQPGNVVANHVILAVPETCPRRLSINIVGRENACSRLAKRLQSTAQLGKLRYIFLGTPGPPVAQKTVVEI